MLMRIFARISGLSKIAECYPTSLAAQDKKLLKQTIKVGAVRYRRCAFIDIDAGGFYFHIRTVFGRSPQMLIPWEAFGNTEATEIYGNRAYQFSVGKPAVATIRVPEAIFNQMSGYLNL